MDYLPRQTPAKLLRERSYFDLMKATEAESFSVKDKNLFKFVYEPEDSSPLTKTVKIERITLPLKDYLSISLDDDSYRSIVSSEAGEPLGRLESVGVALSQDGTGEYISVEGPRAKDEVDARKQSEHASGKAQSSSSTGAHNTGDIEMTHPTREEIDAKLQAVEARMDTRVAEVVGEIKTLVTKLDERDRLYQNQFTAINTKLDSVSNLKWTIVGTGIGVVGLTYAAMAVVGAGFDSGRETAQLMAAAEKSSQAAREAAVAAQQAAGMARYVQDPRAQRGESPEAEVPKK